MIGTTNDSSKIKLTQTSNNKLFFYYHILHNNYKNGKVSFWLDMASPHYLIKEMIVEHIKI